MRVSTLSLSYLLYCSLYPSTEHRDGGILRPHGPSDNRFVRTSRCSKRSTRTQINLMWATVGALRVTRGCRSRRARVASRSRGRRSLRVRHLSRPWSRSRRERETRDRTSRFTLAFLPPSNERRYLRGLFRRQTARSKLSLRSCLNYSHNVNEPRV